MSPGYRSGGFIHTQCLHRPEHRCFVRRIIVEEYTGRGGKGKCTPIEPDVTTGVPGFSRNSVILQHLAPDRTLVEVGVRDQFAAAMAVSMELASPLLSVQLTLTLSPALAPLILKPRKGFLAIPWLHCASSTILSGESGGIVLGFVFQRFHGELFPAQNISDRTDDICNIPLLEPGRKRQAHRLPPDMRRHRELLRPPAKGFLVVGLFRNA